MIVEMLDTLAEYQAQADLLAMKKQELIDSVKVPEEVFAAQDEANKRRVFLDTKLAEIRREIEAACRSEMDAIPMPELPAEYQRAVEEAKNKRYEIQAHYQNEMDAAIIQANGSKAQVDIDLQAQTAMVYAQVAKRKAEITAEFTDKESAVKDNIDKLTGEIKSAVKEAGATFKGKVFQAVYVRGRVTWNTDMLDGMVIAFPALAKARKVGEPSVTLRKI